MSNMLYNRIALFRTEKKLSRKELAVLVEINPQTVGFLERGDYNPSVELALKLARCLGVSVDVLFSLEPFPSLSRLLGDPSVSDDTSKASPDENDQFPSPV
jgi:putative transcriptional regulator